MGKSYLKGGEGASSPWLKPGDSGANIFVEKILKPRGYILNGKADAYGEEPDDRWALVVINNIVYTYAYIFEPNPKQFVG